jgi:hypothetical protein
MFSMTTLSSKIEVRVAPLAARFRARRPIMRKSIQDKAQLENARLRVEPALTRIDRADFVRRGRRRCGTGG